MTKSIFLFHSEVKKNKFNLLRFKQAEKVLIIVFLGVFACVGVKNLIDIPNSAEKKTYPLKAVEFLNRQKIEGEVFSTYNWGGYLIWKLPQKKVFIDGRMPSWRRVGDYPGESNNAFKDWTKALESKKSFKKAILKYNIEYVLLPKTIIKKETGVSASIEKIRKQIFSQKPSTPVTEKDLVSLGLKKVYDDGLVIVYKE